MRLLLLLRGQLWDFLLEKAIRFLQKSSRWRDQRLRATIGLSVDNEQLRVLLELSFDLQDRLDAFFAPALPLQLVQVLERRAVEQELVERSEPFHVVLREETRVEHEVCEQLRVPREQLLLELGLLESGLGGWVKGESELTVVGSAVGEK